MKRRGSRVFLLLGVLLVVIVAAVFLWMSTQGDDGVFDGLTGSPTPAPTPVPIDVVVARRPIPPRAVITDTEYYLTIGGVPPNQYNARPDQYLLDPDEAYLKMISSTFTIPSGTAVLREQLTKPPLSYQMPRNQKGVAVAVDAVSGVGRVLEAGDRVDVILMVNITLIPEPKPGQGDITELSPFEEAAAKTETTVKTVIQDVAVIKVVELPEVQGVTPVDQEIVVILAMRDQDAEIVKFAEMSEDAQVHLVVRRFDERGPEFSEFTTGITSKLLIETYGLPVPCPLAIDGVYPLFACGGGVVP
jgi:Flp pilus assembly protein CpaB